MFAFLKALFARKLTVAGVMADFEQKVTDLRNIVEQQTAARDDISGRIQTLEVEYDLSAREGTKASRLAAKLEELLA